MGGSIISTLKMIFPAEAALPVSASTAGLAFTVRLIIAALLAPQKAEVVLNKFGSFYSGHGMCSLSG